MSEVNQLYASIISKKDNLLQAQDEFGVERSDVIHSKTNLQHRITSLWLVVSVAGGYYVWSNSSPLPEGQSLFAALASRSWAPVEIGFTAGYSALSVAVWSNRAIADLYYGPLPEEGRNENLKKLGSELASEMTKYLISGSEDESRVPVDRLQHLIALDLEPSDVLDLIQEAVGTVGFVSE